MQRKPLFLVASAAESVRFFALAFLADALGGLRGGFGLSPLFRYVSSAQLLCGVAFFFLWFDRSRYDAYRPLLFLGKLLSLASFIPLVIFLLGNVQAFSMRGRAGPVTVLLSLAVDLFGFCILLGTGPLFKASLDDSSPGQGQDQIGPRGPEDIEGVEG